MLKRAFSVSQYHVVIVFIATGLFAIFFAYASYNLLHISMANLQFLHKFGWVAVEEGGLFQLLNILFNGCLALFFFLGFKLCEVDLIQRYHRWQSR